MLQKSKLSAEEREAVSRIHWLVNSGRILRASIVKMKRKCGNKNCRCTKGMLHASLYLYQSKDGKSRMLYVPAALEEEVKACVSRNKEIRKLLDRLSEISWKKIKERQV